MCEMSGEHYDLLWDFERLKPKEWRGQLALVRQVKRDGHRVTFFKQPSDRCLAPGVGVTDGLGNIMTAYFRKDEDVAYRLKEFSWFKQVLEFLPPYSAMDAELWLLEQPASAVPTALKEHDKNLLLAPFALPFFEGSRWHLRDPMQIQTFLKQQGFTPPPMVYIQNTIQVHNWESVAESLRRLAREQKLEGYVLKQHNYEGWFKVKVHKTLDAIVTGIKPGKGKFAGQCGALLCSVWKQSSSDGIIDDLVEIASVSGMDDATRAAISQADEGRVCEIEYQEVASQGRLRHPRFVRWRDDKSASECEWEQLGVTEGGSEESEL